MEILAKKIYLQINQALAYQSNETVSIRNMYNMEMEKVAMVMRWLNATDVMYNNIDLREKFAMFTNDTLFQSFILELTNNLPEFELKMYVWPQKTWSFYMVV